MAAETTAETTIETITMPMHAWRVIHAAAREHARMLDPDAALVFGDISALFGDAGAAIWGALENVMDAPSLYPEPQDYAGFVTETFQGSNPMKFPHVVIGEEYYFFDSTEEGRTGAKEFALHFNLDSGAIDAIYRDGES